VTDRMVFIEEGMANVAHVVEDCEYLRSIMQVIETERAAMIQVGRIQLGILRITARTYPELQPYIDMGERVFGSGL
jgi:division protein CdvB (Snf7/Vps24/ESCRT-III family)